MLNIILVSITAIVFLIVSNLLICKWIIYKSKRKFIMSFVEKKGWILQDVRHVGFFNTGDFNEEMEFSAGSEMGNIVNHTYVYVTAKNCNEKIIRFTAKIITIFFFIKRVEYKGIDIN